MIKLIKKFFSPTTKNTESVFYLADKIVELQEKVAQLERENSELKDLIKGVKINITEQIDKIHPEIYNIHNKQNDT